MAKKKQVIQVLDINISFKYIEEETYFSLTDMSKQYAQRGTSDELIRRWMRNGSTLDFLEVWENHYNPLFNPVHLDGIRVETTRNTSFFSVKTWIEQTNAVGIQARPGRYGGTFAHKDIAFEFATWLDAKFKFYLITEFQRLKEAEQKQKGLNWNLKRELSKINYRLHTETVRRFLVPKDWEGKFKAGGLYANEADMFNIAVFGMTAREWKEANTDAKGNLRDHASELELIVLANLEAINSELIKEKVPTEERFLRLRAIAQYQLVVLNEDVGVKKFMPSEESNE